MFTEFFAWWWRQLLDLVPARLRIRATEADALIADTASPGVIALLRRRRGVEAPVTRINLDDTGQMALRAALNGRPRGEAVVLRLAPGMALERAVNLPLAAERDPERVLGYELERLTPFTADEVFWGFAILARDRERSRLQLRLTLVPRASIAAFVDMLAANGGRPSLLEAPTPGGNRTIRLVHQAGAGRSLALSNRVLAAAAAALALLVIASPFLRQSLALGDLQDQLAILQPRISQVEALRKRISGSSAGGDAVAAETRRLGDTLEALAAITEILPDDSYLTEFTMRERKMTLSGLSASAPKLISGLSDDPRIRNPAFTAPVTRSETNHNDVFSIRAELAP